MSQSGHAQPAERVHATGLASLGIAAADASHNGQAQPAERVHSEVMTAMLSEKPGLNALLFSEPGSHEHRQRVRQSAAQELRSAVALRPAARRHDR
eukprot:COSAG04_NODE_14152_length_578_cov_4.050104_1_plen_96_part_00